MSNSPTASGDYQRAQAACAQGRLTEALELLSRAAANDPNHAPAHLLLGMVMHRLGRHAEALASLDRAIAFGSDTAATFGTRADVLVALGRLATGVESFDAALTRAPDSVEDWCNRGAALHELGRHHDAISSFERALALQPNFAQAHYNRGTALAALGHHQEAIAAYDGALALSPYLADAVNNRGLSLRELGRQEEALAAFEDALALAPDHVDAMCNRATVLQALGRHGEALASAEQALALLPDNAQALYLKGNSLVALGRLEQAMACYERAWALGHRHAFSALLLCSLSACHWQTAERAALEIGPQIDAGRSIISPFALLPFAVAPAEQLACVQRFVQHELGGSKKERNSSRRAPRRDTIRLAYFSADFGAHAVTHLVQGLFERHDRSRFELVGVSVGTDDGSVVRARVAKGFDQFHEVGSRNDDDVADLLTGLAVDIVVDLTGYTESARPKILAHRPVPIQVSYLGFLGTMGAAYDYVLADQIALPFDRQPFYAEKIVHLPDCFLVNDSELAISPCTPSRAEAGLPAEGFVFCSFNNSYKFRAPVFDIWMRLLHAVEGSVLWLLQANAEAAANLRREAARRDVDAARLVFAPRIDFADHLARQRHADLFLDTLPYNAGATAAAALYAGLPVLTCVGDSFPGRMAASMLHAVGLPELVTTRLADYEALALRLATERGLLHSLRLMLGRNRLTHPLFDTDRSCRHLEMAYATMWDIYQRGDPPRSFAVDGLVRRAQCD
jgi:predicted O-linked N-acetylglucosamine transferase (SPINDLY family)